MQSRGGTSRLLTKLRHQAEGLTTHHKNRVRLIHAKGHHETALPALTDMVGMAHRFRSKNAAWEGAHAPFTQETLTIFLVLWVAKSPSHL